jgi:hypothetical protein
MVDHFSSLFAADAIRNMEQQSEYVVDLAIGSDTHLRDHTLKKIMSARSFNEPCSTLWAIAIACNFDKQTRRDLLNQYELVLASDQILEFREFFDTFCYFVHNNKSVVYNIAESEFGHLGEVALKALELEGSDIWSWLAKAFSGIWQWDEHGVLCDQYEVEINAYSNDDISSTILQLVDSVTASDAYAQYKSGFEI